MKSELSKMLPKDELEGYFLGLHQVALALLKSDANLSCLNVVVESAISFLKADGGSIYLCKQKGMLDFQVCINQSFKLPFNPSAIPLNTPSIATWSFNKAETITIPDVYLLNAEDPYEFNITLDNHVGYRTKSTLATPILDVNGKAIGVLQLFNRKNYQTEAWPKDEMKVLGMPSFSMADMELIVLFSQLAAAAIVRNMNVQNKKSA